MVEPTITEKGAAVLVPKMDIVQAAISNFFAEDNEGEVAQGETVPPTDTSAETAPPQASPNAATPQDVRIVVLNGSATAGLEKELADILIAHGYDVVGTGQADRTDYTQTQIIASDNTQVVRQLADLLGVSDQNIRPGASEQLQADIVVIIGADFIMP